LYIQTKSVRICRSYGQRTWYPGKPDNSSAPRCIASATRGAWNLSWHSKDAISSGASQSQTSGIPSVTIAVPVELKLAQLHFVLCFHADHQISRTKQTVICRVKRFRVNSTASGIDTTKKTQQVGRTTAQTPKKFRNSAVIWANFPEVVEPPIFRVSTIDSIAKGIQSSR